MRTVLILGAGASKPYGLPTGDELKRAISSQNDKARVLNASRLNGTRNMSALGRSLQSLCLEFNNSGQSSIDAFLEHRPEYADLGKLCIAAHLVPLERQALKRLDQPHGWIDSLFRALMRRRSLDTAGLSIVTFNYDRLVHLGLASMLRNSTGSTWDEALASVHALQIFHVYGRLSAHFHFDTETFKCVVHHESQDLLASASTIRIMSDEREDGDEILRSAREVVWAAERVIFLGFGYDDVNLRRIGIGKEWDEWTGTGRTILGTAYGPLAAQREEVIANVAVPAMDLGDANAGCKEFLLDNVRW